MLEYLKKVINKENPERVDAFLAVTSGISINVGFIIVIVGLLFTHQPLQIPLGLILTALIGLVNWNKTDKSQ